MIPRTCGFTTSETVYIFTSGKLLIMRPSHAIEQAVVDPMSLHGYLIPFIFRFYFS